MRRFYITLISFIPYIAIAQNAVDRLVLKDGSLHEGYIKLQRVGKDFIFVSEKTTAIITGAAISKRQVLYIDNLPEPWKKWAKENRNLVNQKEKSINLSDIIFNMVKGEDLTGVYVLEEGDEIKYIDLAERTDTIPFTKIQSVERIPAPDSVMSKTIDVITKKNGDREDIIKGQIISQIPGEKVKIRQENGVIKVVKFSDILSESKEKGCSDLSFCAQSKYLEIVRTTSKGKEFEGVITMRYYGNNTNDSYLLVTDKDDAPHKVLMKEVTEIQKTPNKEYKERILLAVEDDHVYVNKKLAQWYRTEKSMFTKKLMVKADAGIVKIQLDKDSQDINVEVEMQNTDENRATFLLKAERKSRDPHLYFALDSMVDDVLPVKKESVNTKETLSRTYALHKGEYVLYRRSDKKCIPLKIE